MTVMYRDEMEQCMKEQRDRIAELEAALKPFADAAHNLMKADKHHKMPQRADDEDVGVLVRYEELLKAVQLVG